MVDNIRLVRNVGQFDNIAPAGHAFQQFTGIYAENGRGKTTLCAIFRSLQAGDATLVMERQRLGTTNEPHVIVQANGVQHSFQNQVWSQPLPNMAVFDDTFVAQNVCSGIEIAADHRQNLHELILGAAGVALNAALQSHVAANEEHNRQLREKGNAIPAATRGTLTVDQFCALTPQDDLATRIVEAERNLAAGQSAAAIQQQPGFVPLNLPVFDVAAIKALLASDLPSVDAEAVARVQAHIARVGPGAEAWVGEGLQFVESSATNDCPFCAQDLSGSPLLAHYRAYFSEAYEAQKRSIEAMIAAIEAAHGGDQPAAFERNVRGIVQRREFWAQFLRMQPFEPDTAGIALAWKVARDAVLSALASKRAAPLERSGLGGDALAAIQAYETVRASIAAEVDEFFALTPDIAVMKERAATANVATLTEDLRRLKQLETRFDAPTAALCDAYLAEKEAKRLTEVARGEARDALDDYRQNVFPAYETAINTYLQRFGAGFRIQGVSPVNIRAGSTATYSVVVNNVAVSVEADGGTSFRNMLSAGDRNTLALAFFLAVIDRDTNLAQMTIVIDDPMTSLDEHRALTTVQEIRRLGQRVQQVIVLSHSKPFLAQLWDGAPSNSRQALRIGRGPGSTSVIDAWDVTADMVDEHDKRVEEAQAYLIQSNPAVERDVAESLRPMLERYVRVAFPANFPPGGKLGQVVQVSQQRLGGANELLSTADTQELRDLLDYANRYHHDTNTAWQTEIINDQELTRFTGRVLNFIRRR